MNPLVERTPGRIVRLKTMKNYYEVTVGTLYYLTDKRYVMVSYFSNKPEWLDFLSVEEVGQLLGGN
jgi:hypothetical protein